MCIIYLLFAYYSDDVTCTYRNGFVVLTLPLPSRNEECEFTLRPVSNTVKNLISFVQDEDGGVDRVAVHTMDGKRVSNSTPIDVLMQNDFKILINEKSFDVNPPKQGEGLK